MAEEEGAPGTEEQDDLQIGPADDTPKGGGKKLLIIIGAIVLLIIIIATTLVFVFFLGGDEKTVSGTEEEAEYIQQYNARMQTTLEPQGQLVFTEPFAYSVNMKNGMNYVRLLFRAELYDSSAKLFLESRIPLIDDKMISLLESKLPQDLKTRTGLEMLKQEIYIELNKLFPQEFIDQSLTKDRMPVKNIRISEFFIQ